MNKVWIILSVSFMLTASILAPVSHAVYGGEEVEGTAEFDSVLP